MPRYEYYPEYRNGKPAVRLVLIDGFPPEPVMPVGGLKSNRCHEPPHGAGCCASHENGPAHPCCKCGQLWRGLTQGELATMKRRLHA